MTVTLKRRQQLRAKLAQKGSGFVVGLDSQGISVLMQPEATLQKSDIPKIYYGNTVSIGTYHGNTTAKTTV